MSPTTPVSVAPLPARAFRWGVIGCLCGAVLVIAACSGKSPDGPTSALQIFKRGVAAYQDEDYPRAAKLFEQAALLDDRNPVIFYNLGLTYYMLEAFPEAIESYHRALKLDSKMADAQMNLALAYDRTYDLEQANAHYNEYLTLVRAAKPATAENSQAKAAAAAAAAKPAKPVLGGQALSSLPGGPQKMKPGEVPPQTGRPRSNQVPANGARAPVSELRRKPADDPRMASKSSSSKDPNASQSNQWWTQDTPPKTR